MRIKRQDPAIYEKDTVLFPQQQSDEGSDDETAAAGGTKSSKPVYLRTVLAQQVRVVGVVVARVRLQSASRR